MSAANGTTRNMQQTTTTSISVPSATLDHPDGCDATSSGVPDDRFERILQLQRQAIYPMDPVAAARAQSQLAHVEVPWLTRQLQETLTRLEDLTSRG